MTAVRHILLGARGNVSIDLTPKQIPHFTFTLTGLLGTIADAPLPSAVYTASRCRCRSTRPTPPFAARHLAVAESLAIDLGNQVEPRFLIGDENIQLVDRNPSGTCVVEARLWRRPTGSPSPRRDARRAGRPTRHGRGQHRQVRCPAVEIGRPTEGQTQKIINYSLPLMLCTDSGDDELKITVK
jgi:hypothetical protein